jgi:hypothetical protein
LFLAEAYCDLEWTLMQQGFDYAYDKRLYDRLRAGSGPNVRGHLWADLAYQNKLCRFLENHDEPRAASLSADMHRAAAAVTYLSPGLRFFHQGQLEGRKVKLPVHLVRAPAEPVDEAVGELYGKLLDLLKRPVLRDGAWRLLECTRAWEGNPTADDFLAFWWQGDRDERFLVAVNYSPHDSQCLVRLPRADLAGKNWQLADQFSAARYIRDGNELTSRGLYLAVEPWRTHVFELTPEPSLPLAGS